jgi:hypothetical protein
VRLGGECLLQLALVVAGREEQRTQLSEVGSRGTDLMSDIRKGVKRAARDWKRTGPS